MVEQAEMFGAMAEEHGGEGYTATTSTEERNKLWQARHDAYWAQLQLRPGARGMATDVCVPISRLADCVGAAQDKLQEMGFLRPSSAMSGDGNFHTLLLVDTDNPEELKKRGRIRRLAQRPRDFHGRHLHRRARDRAGQEALSRPGAGAGDRFHGRRSSARWIPTTS